MNFSFHDTTTPWYFTLTKKYRAIPKPKDENISMPSRTKRYPSTLPRQKCNTKELPVEVLFVNKSIRHQFTKSRKINGETSKSTQRRSREEPHSTKINSRGNDTYSIVTKNQQTQTKIHERHNACSKLFKLKNKLI